MALDIYIRFYYVKWINISGAFSPKILNFLVFSSKCGFLYIPIYNWSKTTTFLLFFSRKILKFRIILFQENHFLYLRKVFLCEMEQHCICVFPKKKSNFWHFLLTAEFCISVRLSYTKLIKKISHGSQRIRLLTTNSRISLQISGDILIYHFRLTWYIIYQFRLKWYIIYHFRFEVIL